MQLKLQRSQRASLVTKTVLFCLDIRAECSPEERSNIARYKLGSEIIYSSAAARQHLANGMAHATRGYNSRLGDAAGAARSFMSLALAKNSAAFRVAAANPSFSVLATNAAFGPMLSNPSFSAALTRN